MLNNVTASSRSLASVANVELTSLKLAENKRFLSELLKN